MPTPIESPTKFQPLGGQKFVSPEEAKQMSPTMLTPEQQALEDPGFFSPSPPLSGLAGIASTKLGMKLSKDIENKLIKAAAPKGVAKPLPRLDITNTIGPRDRLAEDLNAASTSLVLGKREEALAKLVEVTNDLGTLLRLGDKSPVPPEQLSEFLDARNQLGRLLQNAQPQASAIRQVPWFEIRRSK